MEIVDLPGPGDPGPGEVIVRPEAVGICGSDFHIFLGELGSLLPRVQGHEVAAIVETAGPGCDGVAVGERVAVWPVVACGDCYPCRIGRGNVCSKLRLVGVHFDGGLQERLCLPASQVFPVGDQEPSVAAFIEPTSIAVRGVSRGRVREDERVVVLGAGPIGQALCLAARDRGAQILLVDRVQSRLERASPMGVEVLRADSAGGVVAGAREWAGEEGPPVVFDATGSPEVVRSAFELVAPAGRVVVVGLSEQDVSLQLGWFPFKELDALGTNCCSTEDFEEAVRLVAENSRLVERLISHEFPLERAPEAIAYALEHPAEVMKVVVRLPV